jgi:hypothetical protein
MRTLEALGAGKKLVTTNSAIVQYDFFCSDNILVVDRNSPRIPESFFQVPYKQLSSQLYKKYSVSGWLGELFCSDGSVN